MQTKTNGFTGIYEGLSAEGCRHGENRIRVGGKTFNSYLDAKDLPPKGALVTVEFQDKTKLLDSPHLISALPLAKSVSRALARQKEPETPTL